MFIRGIKNVKFARMISPLTDRRVSVLFKSVTPEEGGIRAQGVLADTDDAERLFLKFSILLTDESL